MSWLQEHATLISALASAGMLVVWLVYAWLFYEAFRRQRSSRLFIHQAGGTDIRAQCLLINLSSEPVHIVTTLAFRDGAATRLHDVHKGDDLSVLQREMQGPLNSGESMALGSFDDICRELDTVAPGDGGDGELVEIRAAALHGFRKWPVGARRAFDVDPGRGRVVPENDWTDQLYSRRQAALVRRWMEVS